jgi:hypothetical protein
VVAVTNARFPPIFTTANSGSRAATLAMVFQLAESAQKRWRLLNGSALPADVIQGTLFKDGIKQDAARDQERIPVHNSLTISPAICSVGYFAARR